ncbi:hypothetical protein BsWGS_20177 [Bradybaena similaris]
MFSPLVLTFLGLLFVVSPDLIHSAVFIHPGPCPNNYKPGDVWYLELCRSAVCHEGSYTVMSCGVAHIEHDPSVCYQHYNYTLRYPECCTPTLVCIGDQGFDPIHLIG